MTCVADLMSPVQHTLSSHQPLDDAAKLLRGSDTAVLVVDPGGRTLGVLTDEDLATRAAEHPEGWRQGVCADACSGGVEFLRMGQPVEGVLWRYRTETVRPLAVLNGWKPVGILYPEPVFLWCLDQPHLDFTRITATTATAPVSVPTFVSPDRCGGESQASGGESVSVQHARSEVSLLGSAETVQATTPVRALRPGNEPSRLTRLGSSLGGKDVYTNW
ncbi:CBS domain-containing protein [Nesterenkonia sandarakina]|uniref:CBS domain-containing protein n=1 Tax=Nesterenkonia sandarakina TaxID=272918 RepID=A0A7Z0E6D1_9MICC|nr:CBS domain-containing protein [Nesterenkonia sandarakina]NYJ15490.1 hypothetical protein [Nesterenkonia sandarakina]